MTNGRAVEVWRGYQQLVLVLEVGSIYIVCISLEIYDMLLDIWALHILVQYHILRSFLLLLISAQTSSDLRM